MTKITRQKMQNFIQGNARMIKARVGLESRHLIEQVAYRESKCSDCVKEGHCLGPDCSCGVPGRWFVDESCNLDRFPDLMEPDDWEAFKLANNIIIES
jgi:hypothetical protein